MAGEELNIQLGLKFGKTRGRARTVKLFVRSDYSDASWTPSCVKMEMKTGEG